MEECLVASRGTEAVEMAEGPKVAEVGGAGCRTGRSAGKTVAGE